MQTSSKDVVGVFIILALLVIIYHFYYESKLQINKSTEGFVKGMWEGDESLYRARARAYYSCPPSDCANMKITEKDMFGRNPFRWPDSGRYHLLHPENASEDVSMFEDKPKIEVEPYGQQQDHETFSN